MPKDVLAAVGIPPSHLLAYMLVGYDRRETWERVLYRFHRMADLGIRPFPMMARRLPWHCRRAAAPVGGRRLQFVTVVGPCGAIVAWPFHRPANQRIVRYVMNA
jgi:hypothetical protein